MNEEERGSRKKAIRLKCLDCCCGSAYEVRLCGGAVRGLTAVGKDTLLEVEAPVAIDATGAGDLARSAGALEQDTATRRAKNSLTGKHVMLGWKPPSSGTEKKAVRSRALPKHAPAPATRGL
mgnify:CR=1 FL=1